MLFPGNAAAIPTHLKPTTPHPNTNNTHTHTSWNQTDSCIPAGSTALGNTSWPCRINLNCSPLYPYCR